MTLFPRRGLIKRASFTLGRALMLAVLLVASSGMLEADEGDAAGPVAAPRILSLDRNEGPPGSVILVHGQGFEAPVKAITATLGGKPCLITEVTDTRIYLLSAPDCALGAGQLAIRISDHPLTAQPFMVLDPKKIGEGYWRRRTDEAERSQRESFERERNAMLRIGELRLETDAQGAVRLHATGRADPFADGFRLGLQVQFSGRLVANALAEIHDGRFEASFGPYRRSLFPGRYTVRVSFMLGRQRRSLRLPWIRKIGSERALALQAVEDWKHVELGDLERAEALSLKTRRRYAEICLSLEEQLEELQIVYASTVRSLFRSGQALDLPAWEKWVVAQRFAKDAASLARLRNERRYMRGVHIDPTAWEQHIRSLMSSLRVQYRAVDDIGAEFLVPRYPNAHRKMRSLLSILFDLARTRTRVLFERSGLAVPVDLWTEFGFSPFDPSARSTVGRFRTILRQLDRDLSLESLRRSAVEQRPEPEPPAPLLEGRGSQ